MTYREIRKMLQAAGWEISPGQKHDQAKHPDKPGIKIALPRHKGDIPIGTAKAILKQAGLE